MNRIIVFPNSDCSLRLVLLNGRLARRSEGLKEFKFCRHRIFTPEGTKLAIAYVLFSVHADLSLWLRETVAVFGEQSWVFHPQNLFLP